MGLNLESKKAIVAELSAQVANAQTVVVAEYRGIEVGDLTQLRAKARLSGVYLRVLRNTLARRAVEGTPFSVLVDQLTGPLIYSISNDPVAAAKVLNDFAKGNDLMVIKGGLIGKSVIDEAGVKELTKLPPIEVVRAQLLGLLNTPASQLVGTLNAPASQFVGVLSGGVRQLVNVLNAYASKNPEEAA